MVRLGFTIVAIFSTIRYVTQLYKRISSVQLQAVHLRVLKFDARIAIRFYSIYMLSIQL